MFHSRETEKIGGGGFTSSKTFSSLNFRFTNLYLIPFLTPPDVLCDVKRERERGALNDFPSHTMKHYNRPFLTQQHVSSLSLLYVVKKKKLFNPSHLTLLQLLSLYQLVVCMN
jgi:hypothetical protein